MAMDDGILDDGLLDDELLDDYLRRLCVGRRPPSVEALFELHVAQVEQVPYETFWIHLGEHRTVDPLASVERIARHGKGGYCYHLNGALSMVLAALGYRVTLHGGGVHGPDGPTVESMTNHLVLLVHDLPTDDHPSGTWYVDAGLGDALHRPLPLRPGIHLQGPRRFSLDRRPGGPGDWQFTHDPAAAFSGMAFWEAPTTIDHFATTHHWLSTSPTSTFVNNLLAFRRLADRVLFLRWLTLTETTADSTTTVTVFEHRHEYEQAVADLFHLDLANEPSDRVEALWQRACAVTDQWRQVPS